MTLPFYFQKAAEVGLIETDGTKITRLNREALELTTLVARTVDKLQPTSTQDREDTTDQEAIVLTRVLSAPSGLARELWGKLRAGFGISHRQIIPLSLWSDASLRAIANEIDLTYMGERNAQIISRESLIASFTGLSETSRICPIIDFTQTISKLADPSLINSYGDVDSEWATSLDVLKQRRARAMYVETIHNAKQNIKADTKLEEAFEDLQKRAMEGVGIMRGTLGSAGQSISLLESIVGNAGPGRLNWIDRFSQDFDNVLPVSTGIAAIDIGIGGGVMPDAVQRTTGGRLHTLAARAKTGKSALAINIVSNLAAGGIDAAFLSAELSQDEIEARLISSMSRKLLGFHHWRSAFNKQGYVTVHELMRPEKEDAEAIANVAFHVTRKMQELELPELLVESSYGCCANTAVSAIRAMKARNPALRAVVLDHFHIMGKHKNAPSNGTAMLEERAHILSKVAKEVDIELFLMAQTNQVGIKAAKDFKDKEPEPEVDQIRGTDVLAHLSHALWIVRKHKSNNEAQVKDRKLEVWHKLAREGQHMLVPGRDKVISVKKPIDMSLIRINYPCQSIDYDNTFEEIDRLNSDL